MGRRSSDVRCRSLEAEVIWVSSALRSLAEPICPRPPALVTATAREAVAEPAIWDVC